MSSIDLRLVDKFQLRTCYAASIYEAVCSTLPSHRNIVISPLGVRECICLAYFGAEGRTAAEIQKTFYLPHDRERIAAIIAKNRLAPCDSFVVAQLICIRSNLKFRKEYAKIVEKAFGNVLAKADFRNRRDASYEINNRIESETNRKVYGVTYPPAITPDTAVLLVNATYFRGDWEKPFVTGDRPEILPFWISQSKNVKVEMMRCVNVFKYQYIDDLDVTAVELPYKGEEFAMLILLPGTRTGLNNLEVNLRKIDPFMLSATMKEERIFVRLPKFRVESQFDITYALERMGLETLFAPDADLGGMFKADKVPISSFFHKAIVIVKEAASDSNSGMLKTDYNWSAALPDKTFSVDRPFVFIIKDQRRVFFIGRVIKVDEIFYTTTST